MSSEQSERERARDEHGVLTGQVPAPKEPSEIQPEHNHDVRCCREHGTHAMPHRGCILR